MKNTIDFMGIWALVTGASSGIGEEFARKLAERGANLLLVARSRDRLERLAGDLTRVNGVQARVIALDLSAPDGAASLLATLRQTGHFVELVVNNAGFGSAGPVASLDAVREAAMVRLNVDAVAALTRGLLEPMLDEGRGGFINVASTAAFQAVPYMATYGASKAFVLHYTLALAAELRGTCVRAMALCPGPVRTGFQEAAGIPSPGSRLAELTVRTTVGRALRAYERGDDRCVPGFVNTAQSVAVKLVPRGLVEWAAVRAMHRMGRTGVPHGSRS
ncbi:MAG TPA: SDR family oxidoreductase [Polyangiaceae bacterium]